MTLKKLLLLFIVLSLLCAYTVSADTGTYVLDKQNVDLYIQNDTNVLISYDVDFRVTGGNIPWVTAGLPNSNFNVVNFSGAAKSVVPQNGGGWTGVYITLDKTYYAGDVFNYKFSALQHNFVTNYQGNASVQFTPVYWDNAQIKSMKVTFHFPTPVKSVTSSDANAIFNNGTVTWQFSNLPNGAKRTVGILMPINGTFTFPVQPATPTPTGSSGDSSWILWGMGAIVFFIVLAFILSASSGSSGSDDDDDYEPPKVSLNSALSGKKVTRNLHLNCPKDDSAMVDKVVKEVKAGLCMICGALLFDRGEIEKALKTGITESEFNPTGARSSKPEQDVVPKMCPRCDGAFKKVIKTIGDTKAVVYFCADCGALYMAYGEYTNVKEIHDLQVAENKKAGKSNKDEDNNHWLFYPYIYYPTITGHVSHASGSGGGSYGGGRFGGGGASSCVSHSSCVSSCVSSCHSCACVASCACACACAGGGAAGCSPKDKFYQIHLYDVINEENP